MVHNNVCAICHEYIRGQALNYETKVHTDEKHHRQIYHTKRHDDLSICATYLNTTIEKIAEIIKSNPLVV